MKELFKNKRFRHIMASLIFLAIAAILLMFFLEYRYFLNNFGKAWDFFFKTPQVFFFAEDQYSQPELGPLRFLSLLIFISQSTTRVVTHCFQKISSSQAKRRH